MEGKKIISILIILLVLALTFFLIMRPKELNAPTEKNSIQKMDEVKIEVLKEGTGAVSKNGDELTVDYTGTLEDGTKFDSSIGRAPFVFILGAGRVIQGWEQGMLNMKVGEQRRLTIPSSLGYGPQGAAGGLIPPNATLIFEVELLKIN
ncbi:MAG: FKBP-type peptidyl-prolyl cis-trans isomerase [Candidatus Paceibacterota bacterium]|jgi:peptidylprolyl isomerase/FKBP-type peptidyl-prolyl cis-trans isomerase FkpA